MYRWEVRTPWECLNSLTYFIALFTSLCSFTSFMLFTFVCTLLKIITTIHLHFTLRLLNLQAHFISLYKGQNPIHVLHVGSILLFKKTTTKPCVHAKPSTTFSPNNLVLMFFPESCCFLNLSSEYMWFIDIHSWRFTKTFLHRLQYSVFFQKKLHSIHQLSR